jgi:hypothetical protein
MMKEFAENKRRGIFSRSKRRERELKILNYRAQQLKTSE